MPDLHEFEILLRAWQQHLALEPVSDDFSRSSGFRSALDICARQLSETIKRAAADIDDD